MDPQQRLFLMETWAALEDAGYSDTRLDGSRTGVFVGASSGDYSQILMDSGLPADGFMFTGNAGAMLPARVAYMFNLRGPTLTIDSACSSSLIAVHTACENIESGNCDMAIAGGVSVLATPRLHLLLGKIGMLSPSGACRPFDESADGIVLSEGIGVVILKPLEKALADGDRIHAVIRGSGTNQGGKTSSLTAPSGSAQTELIREVYKRFALNPGSIGYVETHGTGTPLGDPIEIHALCDAFREHSIAPASLPIGSVKGLIGHTLTAAGVASLLKVVLALKNHRRPASFVPTSLNQRIEFADTPFRVDSHGSDWIGTPRRAAISSFGANGANCHMVVEEAPTIPVRQSPELPCYLFAISARTRSQLIQRAQDILRWLEDRGTRYVLADIAFTLNTKRSHLEFRAAFVSVDKAHLADLLRQFLSTGEGADFFVTREDELVNNDLTGSIEQMFASLGRYLNDIEAYRRSLLPIAAAFASGELTDLSLLHTQGGQIVELPPYPFDRTMYWVRSPDTERDIEFWMRHHTVQGEPVLPGAAILQLMVEAVAESTVELAGLRNICWLRPVKSGIELLPDLRRDGKSRYLELQSESNSQRLTFASAEVVLKTSGGTSPSTSRLDRTTIEARCQRAIQKEEFYSLVDARDVSHGRLYRTVEYLWTSQSEALGLVRAPQEEQSWVARLALHPSILDGALQCVMGLLTDRGAELPALLPSSLGELAILKPLTTECLVHVQRAADAIGDYSFDLRIADPVGEDLVLIRNFTLRPVRQLGADGKSAVDAVPCYRPIWKETPWPAQISASQESILIVYQSGDRDLAEALIEQHPDATVFHINPSDSFRVVSARHWEIRPHAFDLERICREMQPVQTIYFLASGNTAPPSTLAELEAIQDRGVVMLFHLVQALDRSRLWQDRARLKLITQDAQNVGASGGKNPWNASAIGFTKALSREFPSLAVNCLDISRQSVTELSAIAKQIATEPESAPGAEIAFRSSRRLIRTIQEMRLPADGNQLPIQVGGCYLIVGGLTGIGFEAAKLLANTSGVKLVLTGRRSLDAERSSRLKQLQQTAYMVIYRQADVADQAAMSALLAEIRQTVGRLNGVIHSAIVLRDASIRTMTETPLREALAPKIAGSWLLERLTRDEPLDFIAFFSSANALMGNAGQSNYAAGCTFQDAFALWLPDGGRRIQVINWGYWNETGIVATEDYSKRIEKQGILGIGNAEGVETLRRVLIHGVRQSVPVRLGDEVLRSIDPSGWSTERIPESSVPSIVAASQSLVRFVINSPIDQRAIAAFEELEEYAQFRLFATFRKLGVFGSGDERWTAQSLVRKLRVHSRYERLFAALLDILLRAGLVKERNGDIVVSAAGLRPESQSRIEGLQTDSNRLRSNYPGIAPHVELLEKCLDCYGEILTGKRDPLTILFPGGSSSLVEGIYQGNALMDYYNSLTAEAVGSAIEAILTKTPNAIIRVIEIGAGTGGTSSAVLNNLDRFTGSILYTYTDVSPALVRQAQLKFGVSRPFCEFRVLDISKDIESQAFGPGFYDLVLAANVLHATSGVMDSLRETKRLLKCDGLLVLNEGTRVQDFATLTFGLTDGWWLFRDADIRLPYAPLLGVHQWRAVLRLAGFRGICEASPAVPSDGQAIQSVILGESDGWVEVPEKVAKETSSETPLEVPMAAETTVGQAGLVDYLRGVFGSVLRLDGKNLARKATFEKYGVDSLVTLEIIRALERDFGQLPQTLLFQCTSLDALSKWLEENKPDEVRNAVPASVLKSKVEAPAVHFPERRNSGTAPIAIVGIAGRYPGGEGLEDFWRNLIDGRECISETPHDRWPNRDFLESAGKTENSTSSNRAGWIDRVDCFDPRFFGISPNEAAGMDPQERLFLEIAWAGIENAGLTPATLVRVPKKAGCREVGVFAGVMYGEYQILAAEEALKGHFVMAGSSASAIANRFSYFCDFRGPSIAVDTACSSSLVAIHLAVQSLRRDECRAAIAGGVNLILHPRHLVALSRMKMLARDGVCRPFGAGACGIVPGEGVGVVVLKTLADAERDRDRILGVIRGSAMNSGGKVSGYTVPNPEAQTDVIREALHDAGVDSSAISYIEAHGTGTELGDPIEISALTQALGRSESPYCAIGSVKANIGHLESAAGIAGLTKVLLQMKHRRVAPSLHTQELNPRIDFLKCPVFVQNKATDWKTSGDSPLLAGVSSFGAGGVNVHLIVEEYPEPAVSRSDIAEPIARDQVIPVSAIDGERVRVLVSQLLPALEAPEPPDFEDCVFTLQSGRVALPFRLAVQAANSAELIQRWKLFLDGTPVREVVFGRSTDNEEEIIEKWEGNPLELAARWVKGADVNWNSMWNGHSPRRIELPGYPFERRQCWFPCSASAAPEAESDTPIALFAPEWVPIARNKSPKDSLDTLLWIGTAPDRKSLTAEFASLDCWSSSSRAILAMPGIDFEPLANDRYRINLVREQDYDTLLEHLKSKGNFPSHVVLRSTNSPAIGVDSAGDYVRNSLNGTLHPLFCLCRALLRSEPAEPVNILYVGGVGDEQPFTDAAAAMLATVAQESTQLRPAVLAVGDAIASDAAAILDAASTIWEQGGSFSFHLDERGLSARGLQRIEPGLYDAKPIWKDGGCYIITGGLGAIGRTLAESAVRAGNVALVLAGRSPLDPNKSGILESWRALGANVTYIVADVGEIAGVRSVVNAARSTGFPLRGIVHAAGIVEDSLLSRKDRISFDRVLRPKLHGVTYLDLLTREDPLDFFLCLSSLSSILGAPGQSDYSAANAFLDGFMLWREGLRQSQLRSGYSRTINLPFWQGGGMSLSEDSQKWMERFAGLRPLAAEDGLRLIQWTLSQNKPQIAIVPGDPEKFNTLLRSRSAVTKSGRATGKIAGSPSAVSSILTQIISGLLGLRPEEIEPLSRLGELGFDSLQLARLGEELQKKLPGLSLDPAVFFENPTVESLSALLGGTDWCEAEPRLALLGSAELSETEPRTSMAIAQPKHEPEHRNEPIAVIGMAGSFPGARTTEDFWELLTSGSDCITEIPRSRWNADLYTGKSVCKWGGFLEDVDRFDPLFFRISPREAASMDPQERLFLETVWHAIENAGYTPARLRASINGSSRRIGVFAGITWGSYQLLAAEEWSRGNMVLAASSYWSVPNRVSWFLDCTGPSIAVDTACSSSLAAIHLAVQSLRRGECEVAIAGGVNLVLHPSKYVALSGLGFLSADGRCRSFGRGANGFVPGEGVGALLLKPLSLAEADGDRIDAVILGSAMNQDGLTTGYTVPNPDAQAELIGLALKDAGVDAQTIRYLEAHGTGTAMGDPLELRGLEKAFRRQTSQTHFCSLGSVKSNIGHLEAAAGVASAIKVILQMRHGTLVPSLHCEEPNPALDLTHSPFVLQSKLEPWQGNQRAGISSFGAGGTNVHIILEGYKSPVAALAGAEDCTSSPEILQISARTSEALRRMAVNLAEHLEIRGASQNLSDIAYTLRRGRVEMEHRAAIAANSVGEAAQRLRGWLAGDSLEDLPERAKSWVSGQTANESAPQPDLSCRPVVLPGYPFERERHWLQTTAPSQAADSQQDRPTLLCPVWCPSPANQGTEAFDLLLFAPDIEMGHKCQRDLAPFRRVTVVLPGDSRFQALESRTFRIDPDEGQHYERLLSECPAAKGILHCWDLVSLANSGSDYGSLRRMFLLAQALLKVKPGPMDIHYFFGDQEREIADRDAVGGFRRSITSACQDLRLRTIRVEAAAANWPSIVNTEAQTDWSDSDIFYRHGARLSREFTPLDQTAPASKKLVEQGVYLITGAAGSLGTKIALHLAQTCRARIVMTGRSPQSSAVQAAIESVRSAGGDAAYFQVDVASESEMRTALAKAEVLLGRVQGVIHCAGVQGRDTLGDMSWHDFETVLRPKLEGARVLHRILDFRSLDFVVFFSSLASVVGDLGSCNYACANRYLDAFAESAGCISIGWPLWADGGMNLDSEVRDMYLAATGLRLLTTESGIEAFDRVLQHGATQTLVLDADDSAIRRLLQAAERTLPKPCGSAVTPVEVDGSVEEMLKNLAASVLSINPEKLNSRTGFSEYGFDSILLKEFAARIAQQYNVDISPSIFFRFSNIAALAGHLKESGVRENNLVLPPHTTSSGEEEVAIVGISGMFPGSPNLQEFWRNLEEGRDLISETPAERWDWRECSRALAGTGREESVRWGGFIEQIAEFDPLFFGISPREAEQMDPQHRLFLQHTWQAIENAGIRPSSLAGSRTAVFAGVQMNEYVQRFHAEAGPQVGTGNAHSMLSNRVSYLLDLRGPSEAIDTACSSSLVAVHRAVQAIRSGEAEFAIAGGVHVLLSPEAVLMAARMGVLSPDGRCRTFDQQADGYVKGEGVGVVFLKSARQARADGDFIHAIIRGTGVNHGGHAMSLTAPNAEAQANLIATVYERAGIDPDSVTLIEAHGTGTPLGDPVEVDALIEAFDRLRHRSGKNSEPAPVCWLGSVKTNIGHLEPASGIAGLLKVILAMRYEKIPATLHQESVNPLLRLDRGRFRISPSTRDWEPFNDESGLPVFRAGVSSFGFGGANCHVLLERFAVRHQQNALQQQRVPEIIPISAKNPKALRDAVRGLLEALQTWGKDYPLRSVAHTLQIGRDTFAERVAFVASDRESLFVQIQNWLNGYPAVFGDSKAEQSARKWMSGGNLAWDIEPGVKGEKVPLPGYPFSKAKYWVPVKPETRSLLPDVRPDSTNAVKLLRSVIGKTLGIADRDLVDHTELSSLGLDSLVQVELRQSLEKIFDLSLSADVFLRYPTIEQLAANLPSAGPSKPLQRSPQSPLMTFHQNGRQAPSFWIHGAPGDTNWLLSLSQSLGPDFPLFGIEAVESASQASVEELAEYYLSVIRESRPVERYRIGGYSFGGAIAVEICRALEQQGEFVQDLILLDTYAPGSADLRYLKENTTITDPAFASLLIGNMLVRRWNAPRLLELGDFRGVKPEEHGEVIANRVGRHSPLNREQLINSIGKASRLATRHDGFLNGYRPEPFVCRARVTLFRAALGFTAKGNTLALPPISAPAGDSPEVWRILLGTDVATREFPCDHFGLLSGSEASGVADELREILSYQTEGGPNAAS